MASTNLGRVQGAGVFTSTAESSTSVAVSTVSPTTIAPLVGDAVYFASGDVRLVTATDGSTLTLGEVVANLTGPQGSQGLQGEQGQQGAGFFSTTAESSTSISLSDLSPSITPLVGDTVVFLSSGDIRTVTSVGTSTVSLSSVVANLNSTLFPFGSMAIEASTTGWYEIGRVPMQSGGGCYSGIFDVTFIDTTGTSAPYSGRVHISGVNDGTSQWASLYTRIQQLSGDLESRVGVKNDEDGDYLRVYAVCQSGYRTEINCVSEYYGTTPSKIMEFTGTYYGSAPSGIVYPTVTNIASGTSSASLSAGDNLAGGSESIADAGAEEVINEE